MGLYAGDISAVAAWEMLSNEHGSILVDVRTPEEWRDVGTPDLSTLKKQPVFISWLNGGDYTVNTNFLNELQDLNADKNTKILFLCKSGGRSREAAVAVTSAGYTQAFNIVNGFEADNGWKSTNLPYIKKEAKQA